MSIQVLPIARIELPDGVDFVIVVPEGKHDEYDDHHDDDHHDDEHDDKKHPHGGDSADRHDQIHHVDAGKHDEHKADKDKGADRHSSRDDHGNHGHGDKNHQHHGHHVGKPSSASIEPVVIPFVVRGNATASVSVVPDSFMRIDHTSLFLGRATRFDGDAHHHHEGDHGKHRGHDYSEHRGRGHDKGKKWDQNSGHGDTNNLGYNVIVRFPVQSWTGANVLARTGTGLWGDGWASLPGHDGQGTPPLTADVSQASDGVSGKIFIFAKDNWTMDGNDAESGKYRGSVSVILTSIGQ